MANTGRPTRPAIRVLVVGDGPFMGNSPPKYGIQFLKDANGNYIQDAYDTTFTVSQFIYLLTTANRGIWVTTAHRRNDPNADIPNFNFATSTDLWVYDVLWIFGYEGWNGTDPGYGSAICADEGQAIAEFMEAGGGVFATGDHAGMGSFICGQIPRVRSMRMWYGQASFPPGVPTHAVNSQGLTVSAVNWPGGGADRADTLQMNSSDSAAAFQFDDQSDGVAQQLSFPGGQVHPILAGTQGAISRFPDHMHEGEVVTPLDITLEVTINGQLVPEYPPAGHLRLTPVPSIIATGQTVGGHETLVEGTSCETIFVNDPTPTAANRQLGVLCAYDGRDVGVGRVVTDSSFHHYLDLNLIGDPCGSSPDRQQGFGPAYTPPAAGTVLADLQAFYVNTVEWLSRMKCQFISHLGPFDRIVEGQVAATLGGSTPGVLFNVFSVVVSGFSAADLGITQSDLSGTPGVVPAFTSSVAGLTVTATGLQAEDASLPATPQQFTWVCAADFDTSLSAFAGATNISPVWVTLTASVSGVSDSVWVALALRGGPPVTG